MSFGNKDVKTGTDIDVGNKKTSRIEADRITVQREEVRKQQEESKRKLQIDIIKRRLDRAETDLRSREVLQAGIKRDLKKVEDDILKLRNEINRTKTTVDSLSREAETHDDRVSGAGARLEEAKSKVEVLDQEIPTILSNYAENKSALDGVEKQITELRDELNRLTGEAGRLKVKVIENEKAIQSKKIQKEKLITGLKSLETGARGIEGTKNKVIQAVAGQTEQIKKSSEQLTTKEKMRGILIEQDREVTRQIQNLNKEISSMRGEIESLKR